MAQKTPERVLAYDLGGTKVAVGVVDRRGRVLSSRRVPVVIREGKKAVLKQLADLGLEQLRQFPDVARVGVASAGPLDPRTGMLLDPTNFVSAEGGWGPTPVARLLSRSLKRPVILENDAAAAMLAEHWRGAARGYKNSVILTLGTGLGTGMIADGELVRAGRGLHPEGGHLILRAGDRHALCGCGNLGCAEAYLSGNGFARWFAAQHGLRGKIPQGKELADLARAGNRRAKAAFAEYSELLATLIHNFAVLYAPEIVVVTGSFAAAADLFLKPASRRLEELLARRREGVDMMPELAVSRLDNQAGLLGGAYVALFNQP